MKRFGKVLGLAVLTAAAAVFLGCPTPNNNTGGGTGTNLWDTEGIELITSLANQSTGWGAPIEIPPSYAKRLQAGSRVIFELSKNTTTNEDGVEYTNLKFHVQNGNWEAVGVEDYYDANGKKLNVTEDLPKNPGIYNTDAIEDGTYYFDVKATNLDKLKAGFAFGGNLKVVRLGITNLAAKQDTDPNAAVYSGDEIVFNVIDNSTNENDTILLIKYDREKGEEKKITLSDVILSVSINDKTVSTPEELDFKLDIHGGKFEGNDETPENAKEYKVTVSVNKVLHKNDVVKVKLESAKLAAKEKDVTDDVISSIQIALIDNAAAVDWYNELSETEYEPLITKKNGEKFPADDDPVGPEPDPDEPRPEIGDVVYEAKENDDLTIKIPVNFYDNSNHGIQFAVPGSKYLPKGAKANEEYTIVMKGTADEDFEANIQFLTADWKGFGEAIKGDFKTSGFEVSGEYTFGYDTANDFQFVISNQTESLDSEKTLTLTKFTITRTK